MRSLQWSYTVISLVFGLHLLYSLCVFTPEMQIPLYDLFRQFSTHNDTCRSQLYLFNTKLTSKADTLVVHSKIRHDSKLVDRQPKNLADMYSILLCMGVVHSSLSLLCIFACGDPLPDLMLGYLCDEDTSITWIAGLVLGPNGIQIREIPLQTELPTSTLVDDNDRVQTLIILHGLVILVHNKAAVLICDHCQLS